MNAEVPMNARPYRVAWVLLFLSFSSCATVQQEESPTDYYRTIQYLQQQLMIKAGDPVLQRDLGIAYFQVKEYESAKLHLYRSFIKESQDPKTIFYYGMTLEYLLQVESALSVYVNYTDISSFSPYKKLVEGRYRTLLREVVHKQLQTIVANEKVLRTENLSSRSVAVFPLTYQGTDERYAPLSKGLSEMMLIDLGQVKGLTVVERIRTEELLNELKFGQTVYVDRTTAPRLGKFLRAGRVVTGTYSVRSNSIRMDVAAWDVVNRRFPELTSKSDDIDNLFKIEKDLVFSIIAELGITLTQEERDKIQAVPTKNLFAFMNYCLGLRSEDAYDFVAAGVYYKQAALIDPSFKLAAKKVEAMNAITVGGGPKEKVLLAAQQVDNPLMMVENKKRRRLIDQRLGHLSEGLGRGFQSGADDRKPVEEAAGSGADIGKLPPPPVPPGR